MLYRLKGIKTAHNLVLLSSSTKPKITFIYELNQRSQKARTKASLRAKDILKDDKKTVELLEQLTGKIQDIPGLGEYLQDIPLVCSMIYDYIKGRYKEIPFSTIVALTAAIIYFASPIDLIPDIVPIIGQVDDIYVIKYALEKTHDDVMKYKSWKFKQKPGIKEGINESYGL